MARRASKPAPRKLPPYRQSIAGTLLLAREEVMAPIRPLLREYGVTEQQWRVLRVLDDLGPIDPTTLAEASLLFAPSVTRIVKELHERDLITRTTDPADRRRVIISLATGGRAVIRRVSRLTLRQLDVYAVQFGKARLGRLMIELHAFIGAIGTRSDR